MTVILCGIFSVVYLQCDVCNLRVPLIREQVARRVVATGGRGDTLTMLQEGRGAWLHHTHPRYYTLSHTLPINKVYTMTATPT